MTVRYNNKSYKKLITGLDKLISSVFEKILHVPITEQSLPCQGKLQ